MLRVTGRILNLESRDSTTKDGKPFHSLNVLFIDEDNEVHQLRFFDRDGSVRIREKKLKVGDQMTFRVDKTERLTNRTFDTLAQFID